MPDFEANLLGNRFNGTFGNFAVRVVLIVRTSSLSSLSPAVKRYKHCSFFIVSPSLPSSTYVSSASCSAFTRIVYHLVIHPAVQI